MSNQEILTNHQIVAILKEVLAAMEIKNVNRFRIRAYQNAIESIDSLTISVYDLWRQNRLDEVNGIGSALKQHLDDLFTKGAVKDFEEIKKDLPSGMFSLIGIQGIGAKKAFKLASAFNLLDRDIAVETLGEHAEKGEIRVLEGFGEKSEQDILDAIKQSKMTKNEKPRMLLSHAESIADRVLNYVKNSSDVLDAVALGSLRRRESTVGDLDIAVSTNAPAGVLEHFSDFVEIREILSKGDKKMSVVLNNDTQVDLRVIDPEAFGSMLQYFTGSKQHNVLLRTHALSKGLSLSEYGIKKSNALQKFSSEVDFYEHLGLAHIPPELRQARDEIELAKSGSLPNLICVENMRGDIHTHTVASDGQNTILEMAEYAKKLGYEYLGISDHAPSVTNRGLEETKNIIRTQKNNIEQINTSNKYPRLLLGYEINILADATLSMPDELLMDLDYCIASIHTSFDQSRDQITTRLVEAIKNPYVNVIGHPTGRLINEREPYQVDWQTVLQAALDYGKALEINAQPSRLDLPDDLVYEARKMGIKLIINTDAHNLSSLDYMHFGIDVARRGWCAEEDVLNTLPLPEFLRQLKNK